MKINEKFDFRKNTTFDRMLGEITKTIDLAQKSGNPLFDLEGRQILSGLW